MKGTSVGEGMVRDGGKGVVGCSSSSPTTSTITPSLRRGFRGSASGKGGYGTGGRGKGTEGGVRM